jgi:hypothetical protein
LRSHPESTTDTATAATSVIAREKEGLVLNIDLYRRPLKASLGLC